MYESIIVSFIIDNFFVNGKTIKRVQNTQKTKIKIS